MTDTETRDRVQSDTARAWYVGGGLLLASAVVGATADPTLNTVVGGNILRIALFSAGLLVFAYGWHVSGSVTARRPLGTAALTRMALWILVGTVLDPIITSSLLDGSTTTPFLVFAYADAAVQFVLAAIAVIQIARAGIVPAPWHRLPAWALAAASVTWLMAQFLGGGTVLTPSPPTVLVLSLFNGVLYGSAVLLGTVATVLADRAHRGQPAGRQLP